MQKFRHQSQIYFWILKLPTQPCLIGINQTLKGQPTHEKYQISKIMSLWTSHGSSPWKPTQNPFKSANDALCLSKNANQKKKVLQLNLLCYIYVINSPAILEVLVPCLPRMLGCRSHLIFVSLAMCCKQFVNATVFHHYVKYDAYRIPDQLWR